MVCWRTLPRCMLGRMSLYGKICTRQSIVIVLSIRGRFPAEKRERTLRERLPPRGCSLRYCWFRAGRFSHPGHNFSWSLEGPAGIRTCYALLLLPGLNAIDLLYWFRTLGLSSRFWTPYCPMRLWTSDLPCCFRALA